jgi:hypothetical protein
MTEAIERNVTETAREQFEALISTYAPYINLNDFQLSNESEYVELLQNIQDHKYLTNEGIPFEITMEQALFSWFENVFDPMTRMIDEEGLLWAFPGISRGELFMRVTSHWNFLKQESGRDVGFEEAVNSYGARFGAGVISRFLYRIKRLAA